MAKASGLTRADQQLWAAFSQTILPLPGRTRQPVEPVPVAAGSASAAPAQPAQSTRRNVTPKAAIKPVRIDSPPPGLDKSTWRKFAGAKIRATKKLDLHGHTAAHAHHAVIQFIERAHADRDRCIEIITGKGDVLARELPLWLNAASVRPLILAIAHPHAANTGSVRILLKRIR